MDSMDSFNKQMNSFNKNMDSFNKHMRPCGHHRTEELWGNLWEVRGADGYRAGVATGRIAQRKQNFCMLMFAHTGEEDWI